VHLYKFQGTPYRPEAIINDWEKKIGDMLNTLHSDNERSILIKIYYRTCGAQLPRATSMLVALSVTEVRKLNVAYFSYLNEPIFSDDESRLSFNAVTIQ
jgi:hypothetical protein